SWFPPTQPSRSPTSKASKSSVSRFRLTSWKGSSTFPGSRPKLVHKHHRPTAVRDHAILEVITDRARQHAPLDVAALGHEIVGRVAMTDALDVLVDDRAFVEIARHVMRSGADQLDAALMRLVIGLCALEARQERVMDVDAASRQLCREIIRQDLHVARE